MRINAKKWSLLGVVLVAASAVTAAVLPKNSDSNRFEANGSMTDSSGLPGGTVSCKLTENIVDQPCFASTGVATDTTTAGLTSDTFVTEEGNTTD